MAGITRAQKTAKKTRKSWVHLSSDGDLVIDFVSHRTVLLVGVVKRDADGRLCHSRLAVLVHQLLQVCGANLCHKDHNFTIKYQYWEIHIAAKEMPGQSKVKVKDRGERKLINFKIYSWVTLDVTHTLLYIAHVKILSCCYLMLLFELWRSWMVVGRDNSADDDAV